MEIKKGKFYNIKFAGSIYLAKFVDKIKLNDGSFSFLFTDGVYKYPIRKENILLFKNFKN